jgi:glycerophosphoryl diester phosphodiesterase
LYNAQGLRINYLQALLFTGRRAAAILQLAVRMIGWILIYAVPFLAITALIYLLLLHRYDINFYLSERPPEFFLAAGLIGLTVLTMALVMVRVLAGWVYALPLVLFAEVPVAAALRTSRQAAYGRHQVIASWLAGWFMAVTVIVTLGIVLIDSIGDFIIPALSGRIGLLIFALGTLVLSATFVNLIFTFIGEALLCLLLVRLYRAKGFGSRLALSEVADDRRHWYTRHLRLTARTVFAGIIAAAVAAITIGVVILDRLEFEDHAQVIAHRGASAAAPENTLAAIQQAIADGAGWAEIDVQLSADGEVVVIHDSDLMKVAGVDLKIAETDYARLSAIDIGSRFSSTFQHQRIPTLRQVLETARGRIGVVIELKYYGASPKLAERVVEVVENTADAPPVKVISLVPTALQQMRSLRPAWQTGLLTSVAIGNVAGLDVDFFAVNAAFVTRSFIKRIHGSGKQVMVWTVNDPVGMSVMLSRGVDGIITDHPELAVAVLEQRAQLSPLERLLLYLATLFGREPQYREQ